MKYLITESQYNFLIETRHGMLNYLIKKSKEYTGTEWPEYVIKDWMYKKTTDVEGLLKMFKHFIDVYGIGRWEFKTVDLSLDSFTEFVQNDLKIKMNGVINKDIPNDLQRHSLQQSQLNTKGISPEPIILYQTEDGKYDLIEGYHRTTASLKKYGNYKQNAWVYINI